ncbi:MAG: GAF domain-containing protein, partial [Myxococcales bacterium]|nr:GAF domain-containing protein [Myxococcales bacterium]
AIVAYDQAIEAAARAGFVQDEAFANERAARFHRRRGAPRVARIYLRDARLGYARWGAAAKVAQLDAHDPDLALAVPFGGARPAHGSSPVIPTRVADLDLETLLKATQAIAEEVELDALLRRSMRVLLESVGARRAVLLLAHRGGLQIRAVGAADGGVAVDAGAPFEDGAQVPPTLIRRIWRRGESEVYADVQQAPGAATDPRLRARRGGPTTSALCARFSHLGKPLGVLYFENDLAAGPFSEDRVRVLNVLAPQLAVSVRNARLHAAQDRFVPSQYLRSLNRADIVDVELGDHQAKEVTVFFSDMRGFTSLVEHMPPAEALEFVNRYMAYAEPAITEGGGFVDAYLGDGILALFDHPAHHAQDAVSAAIAVHRALDRLNVERRSQGRPSVRTGIGLNTGRVILGTIGGPQAMKCGVVGDAVNLASRIEGLTAEYRVRLLLADTTVERLGPAPPFDLRRAARVRVKGRAQPVTVYEVLDAEPEDVRDALLDIRDDYERAWSAYHAGDVEAAHAGFVACAERAPDDALSVIYRDRAEALRAGGVPPDWDGTVRY